MTNKMKNYRDLDSNQIKEIVFLAYGQPDWIVSELKITFQDYDWAMYEDAIEQLIVRFDCNGRGNKISHNSLTLSPQLDIDISSYFCGEDGLMVVSSLSRLPIRNQFSIFTKFKEWGIQPIKI